MRRRSLRGFSASVVLFAQISAVAAAGQAADASPEPADTQKTQSEIAKYCLNNASAVADAHLAWQKAQLAQMEDQLKQKIGQLQEKEEEDKKWVAARQLLLSKGQESVVAIFSNMRPESAALELSAMDDDIAAAVLLKLNARNASAILNEIDPPRAARLTDVMAGKDPSSPGTKKAL